MNILLKISEGLQNSKYTHPHLNGENDSYQKFFLLTYRRCGANYFLDLLRSHPNIVSFAGLYEKNKLGFSYPGYPQVSDKRTVRYRDHYPIEFLKKRIYRNYSSEIKAVGFKLIYETRHPSVLEYLKQSEDVKLIHLQRRNLLRVHLSDMIAKKTQKWHVLSKEHEQEIKKIDAESFISYSHEKKDTILPDEFKIELLYENCISEFEKITQLIEHFQKFFSKNKVHVIYYEDLIENLEEETRKVQEFIGVENKALTSRFIRINNKKLSDVISNYYELKEKFNGSPWEKFFDD